METAIIIARCSTTAEKQNVGIQTNLLTTKYGNTYDIKETYSYYCSGTKNDDHNATMLKYCIDNGIQNILLTELSRVSRTVLGCVQFLHDCTKNGINVVVDNYNLHTLNADKTPNTVAELVLNMVSSICAIELRETKRRLDAGLKNHLDAGGRVGRLPNVKQDKNVILSKHSEVVRMIKQGVSLRTIAKATGKSKTTVMKVKSLMS